MTVAGVGGTVVSTEDVRRYRYVSGAAVCWDGCLRSLRIALSLMYSAGAAAPCTK